MNPEQIKELLAALEEMRGDVTAQISKISDRCDALDAAMGHLPADLQSRFPS